MRFLLIHAEGEALKQRAGVRVLEFTSNPELDADGCDGEVKPLTEDVETALSQLADREKISGDGAFIVVPLAAAYTVNAKRQSSYTVTSTSSA